MIQIQKSATADTRTCDFANTTKETLLASSRTHIGDVVKAMSFFSGKLFEAAGEHDYDKLTAIDTGDILRVVDTSDILRVVN